MTDHRSREEQITENIGEAFRFIEKVQRTPALLDQIPEGARLRIVPKRGFRQQALHARSWLLRRSRAIHAGDQVAYVRDTAKQERLGP